VGNVPGKRGRVLLRNVAKRVGGGYESDEKNLTREWEGGCWVNGSIEGGIKSRGKSPTMTDAAGGGRRKKWRLLLGSKSRPYVYASGRGVGRLDEPYRGEIKGGRGKRREIGPGTLSNHRFLFPFRDQGQWHYKKWQRVGIWEWLQPFELEARSDAGRRSGCKGGTTSERDLTGGLRSWGGTEAGV